MDAWLIADLHVALSGQPLPLATLVAAAGSPVTELHPGAPDRPVMLVTKRKDRVYLDPFTAQVLAFRKGPLASVWLRQLHKNLLAGETGAWFVVTATFVLIFQAVSGMYLWWPLKRISIKTGASTRRIVFDTHHTGGFFTSGFILAICITGLVRHYPSLTDLFFGRPPAGGALAPSRAGSSISVDEAAAIAQVQFPGARVVRINLPQSPGKPFVISARYPGDTSPFGLSEVTLDSRGGAVLALEDFRAQAAADRAQRLDRAIHTGEIAGYGGRALACITALAVLVELVTGVWMWWKRTHADSGSRRSITPASAVGPAQSSR